MINARNYSITKRLTMMNILVSGAALFMACAAFVAYDVVTFRQAMVHNLSIQAQITGSNTVSALLFSDPQSAQNTLSALQVAPNMGAMTGGKSPLCLPFPRVNQRFTVLRTEN